MEHTKLESCQTLRYHSRCTALHSQPIICKNESLVRNVPLLALVIAFGLYLERGPSRTVFPTLESSINCGGDLTVMGKRLVEDHTHNVWGSYGLLIGSSISASADTKDKNGYTVSFKGLIEPYIGKIARATTIDDLTEALGEIRKKLEELE